MKPALDANRLLGRLRDVSLEQVEDAIDYHQRRIDALRLLRQIVEIRQEAERVCLAFLIWAF